MAATNIGSSKYPLAKIPAMADATDIQVALKYYHWGQETEPETTPAPAGISKYLDELDGRIDTLETDIDNVVLTSIVDAKGDLIVGTADNTVDNLTAGSDGHYLVADSTQTLGLKWQALPLNDTLTSTSTSQAATASTVKTLQDTKAALNYSTNAQTGTSYSLVKTDNGYIIEMNNASANIVVIPVNASVAFPVGTKIDIIQTGAGATSASTVAGVTLNSDTAKRTINAQWAAASLIKRSTNTWILVGALKA